ncbi:hypothetical protein [Sodalis sp.]|uniref:hypothetical protein n=1 Tax=Sodalis sp. (in: enterobacteria) TaxID=1898979 RepID=UPI0038732F48
MFIDYKLHPEKNTAATLLGKTLNQEARPGEYAAFILKARQHANPRYLLSLFPTIATTAVLLMAIMVEVDGRIGRRKM